MKKCKWVSLPFVNMSKILKCFTTLIITVSIFCSPTIASASSVYLNIPGVHQEQTKWCWAASSQSIIEYLGKGYPSQTNIVTTVLGSPVNQGATFAQDRSSLTSYNVSTNAVTLPLPWTTVTDNLQNWYSPIKAGIRFSYGDHDVVIYGYYQDAYTTNVSYMDPAPALPNVWYASTYSYFKSNSNWTWIDSMDYNQ